jgi:hypothetical protein
VGWEEWQSDMSRHIFIENTVGVVQYNKDHTTTIWNDKNRPITVWNIDNANAGIVKLLKQNDPRFSDIPDMASGGCNFMVTLAAVQIMTGETLSSGQIKNIWKNAIESKLLSDGGTVEDRNALADMALKQLGRTDIGIRIDDTFKSKPES